MSFEDDVRAQPAALRDLARHADEVGRAREAIPWDRSRIVLSGMGSSHFACYAPWLRLVAEGRAAWTVEAGELLHHAQRLVDEETIVVLVSQSGESVEVRRLLEAFRARRPFVVGITNQLESTLGRTADVVVELRAGEEEAVSTKTSLNTLAVFDLLVGDSNGDTLGRVADGLEGWLQSLAVHVDAAADAAGRPQSMVVAARGSSLASARIGALVLKEAAKTHAEAMGGGEFRHGPLELASPRLALLVLRGPERTAGLQEGLASELSAHTQVVWVGSDPPAGVAMAPFPMLPGDVGRLIGELVALQAVTIGIARTKGITPGFFKLATKVTSTE